MSAATGLSLSLPAHEEEGKADCPICLDPMDGADRKHPLQCESDRCVFNMCRACVESLITSSKDDYLEASDGNRHVKVFLHCPNCRSDLGPTIRETLLLRKADFLITNADLPNEELTPSQLRLRRVLDDAEVQAAVGDARKREKAFFKEKPEHRPDHRISFADNDDSDESVDEWGVEADLTAGVLEFFRVPKHRRSEAKEEDNPNKKGNVDATLLSGLESALNADEQKEVGELMASGDPNSLAQAARILHGCVNSRKLASTKSFVRRRSLRSSVFVLIDEAEKARPAAGRRFNAEGRKFAKMNFAREQAAMRRQLEYLKHHPLPVRMPKYVELSLTGENFPLTFLDDTWDGTVADAYSKISIGRGFGRRGRVHKKRTANRGVINVLSEGVNPDDASRVNDHIDVPKGRVLVASVQNEAGRKGVMKGDVVTHLNGEEFDGTAADLVEAIGQYAKEQDNCGKSLRMVLNAERSVAEALRRRAKTANKFVG